MPPEVSLLASASASAEADGSSWSFSAVGWPWWLVVPLAILAFVAIRRLARSELLPLGDGARRLILGLRGAVAALLVLLLLEPSCVARRFWTEPSKVRVVIDDSISSGTIDEGMSPTLQLDEIGLLELHEIPDRPLAGREAVAAFEELAEDLPAVMPALRALGRPDVDEDDPDVERGLERVRTYRERLEGPVAVLGDREELGDGIVGLHARLGEILDLTEIDGEDWDPGVHGRRATELRTEFSEIRPHLRKLARHARRTQEDLDRAYLDDAGPELVKAVELLESMTRLERLALLSEQRVDRRLREVGAEPEYVGLGGNPRRYDPGELREEIDRALAELAMSTDYQSGLEALAGSSSREHLGAVLMLGDGRATSGGDPSPALRSLDSRGVRVGGVVIGDPEPPRDAVVGEIIGSTETFKDEQVNLDVRYRITGFPERRWRLVLEREGERVDEREVVGTGEWERERFHFTGDRTGLLQVVARIEPIEEDVVAVEGQGILREWWTGTPGEHAEALRRLLREGEREADGRETLARFEAPNDWADLYGQRLRGWIVPPMSGEYTFWITADDTAELWLSTDRDAANKSLVAKVEGWLPPGSWKGSERMVSKPVELRAGQPYYIEALHKENEGSDHCAVGWKLPDSQLERPIPGGRLIPWNEVGPEAGAEEAEEREEVNVDNNFAQLAIRVSEDPLRILLLDDKARWEARYLTALFERDRRSELIRRYASVRIPRGKHVLMPETQEVLDRFDLVILGDLPAKLLDPDDQKMLVDFVTRRGGFLVVLAGRQAMPVAYSLGPLAKLLPVMGADTEGEPPPAAGLRLTDEGVTDPITQVLEDRQLNRRMWKALPRLGWIHRGVRPKPHARVLVETDDGLRTPVVALNRVGGGRVLYLGTDEGWRWRERLGERVHQTFWQQAMRWGLGLRLRGATPRLQVALEDTMLEVDESTLLRARARDAEGHPVVEGVETNLVKLDHEGAPIPETRRVLKMARVAKSNGLTSQVLGDLTTGRWRARVTVDREGFDGIEEVRELIVRRRRSLEALDLSADPPGLASLLDAGDGRVADAAGFAEVMDDLVEGLEPRERERVRKTDLWNNYWVLLLLTGMLFGEWLWRKRNGLP